jgi:hypothetical protein
MEGATKTVGGDVTEDNINDIKKEDAYIFCVGDNKVDGANMTVG